MNATTGELQRSLPKNPHPLGSGSDNQPSSPCASAGGLTTPEDAAAASSRGNLDALKRWLAIRDDDKPKADKAWQNELRLFFTGPARSHGSSNDPALHTCARVMLRGSDC